jgi:hypothetical protein
MEWICSTSFIILKERKNGVASGAFRIISCQVATMQSFDSILLKSLEMLHEYGINTILNTTG